MVFVSIIWAVHICYQSILGIRLVSIGPNLLFFQILNLICLLIAMVATFMVIAAMVTVQTREAMTRAGGDMDQHVTRHHQLERLEQSGCRLW